MTSGIVSSSSLPDRPSLLGGFARFVSMVGCCWVSDTISAFAPVSSMRLAPGAVKLRIANVRQFPDRALAEASWHVATKTPQTLCYSQLYSANRAVSRDTKD